MQTHTEGAAERPDPAVGDRVEVDWANLWRSAIVVGFAQAPDGVSRDLIRVKILEGAFRGPTNFREHQWRWPEAGAVQVQGEGFAPTELHSLCGECGEALDAGDGALFLGRGLCRQCGEAAMAIPTGEVPSGKRSVPAKAAPPGPRLVSMGGAGRFSWRLVYEGGAREFVGLLVNDQTRAIVHTERGADSEAVTNALLARLDSMLDPRDTRYEAPAVKRLASEVSGLMGLHGVSSGLDRRIGDLTHGLQRVRRAVLDVALDWYERQRREWETAPALGVLAPGDREIARQVHERQVADLFTKIGGAL